MSEVAALQQEKPLLLVGSESPLWTSLEYGFWIEHLQKSETTPLSERERGTSISATQEDDGTFFRKFLLKRDIHKLYDVRRTKENTVNEVERVDLEDPNCVGVLMKGLRRTIKQVKKATAERNKDDSSSSNKRNHSMSFSLIGLNSEPESYSDLESSFRSQAQKRASVILGGSFNESGLSLMTDKPDLLEFSAPNMERDIANQFYNSPFILQYHLQRILVVDQVHKAVMVCTPAQAAAYKIQKERNDNASLQNTQKVTEIDPSLLEKVFSDLVNGRGNGMVWDETAVALRVDLGGVELCIDGFPKNGGWGKFLYSMLSKKMRWLSIIPGQVVPRDHPCKDWGGYSLLFRDVEAELLLGEHRRYKGLNGVQFRGGQAVVFETTEGSRTHMLANARAMAPGESVSLFNQETRQGIDGKIWWLRSTNAIDVTQVPPTEQQYEATE